MHIITVLGLVFALVFGMIAFGSMMTLNADISALTSGGLQSLLALFPTFWMILVGAIAVGGLMAALAFMLR